MKYHWYYYTYRCQSRRGTENGSMTEAFTRTIEGPNFRMSLNLMIKNCSKAIKDSGGIDIGNILISDIFYVGHFEQMDEVTE